MKKYLDLFVSEAGEHIQAAAHEAARLSAGPARTEALKSLYRHFHSIKGMAASMGFAPITALSHAVEDLFDRLLKGDIEMLAERNDLVMEALDALSAMVAQAAAGSEAATMLDPAPLIGKIRALLPPAARASGLAAPPAPRIEAGPGAPSPAPETPLPASKHRFRCRIEIDPKAEFPGARAALALHRLEKIGRIAGCTPSQEALRTADFNGVITVELDTDRPEPAVIACLQDLLDLRRLAVEEETRPDPASPPAAPASEAEPPAQATVRIQTSQLDSFLDSISEMMARRGALAEALKARQIDAAKGALEKLSEAIDGLRGQVMEIRLMPFEHIAPRLERTVREVARRTGKRVSLKITGSEVALDRSVLEGIIDPLNHVLRNAVDHGIELPAERELAGKPPEGALRMDVSRAADHVVLVVEDDGRGMDIEAIRRKAVSRGFVTEAELATMDESRVLMLTTIPGFSTAAKVTEVSGRGVGMDIVHTRVEAMRGHMSIWSRRGQGTKITLSLPLTVAVVDAFLVEGRTGLFAVPAGAVDSVEMVEPARLRSSLSGCFLAPEPGRPEGPALVPVFDLDETLGLEMGGAVAGGGGPAEAAPPRKDLVPMLAYQLDGTHGALAVGKILGRTDLVVKPLGAPLERLRRYSGVALLDDGGLALILDLGNLGRGA